MDSFKSYYEDKPRHSILISANILQNLKCGAPKHLYGKYLHQLEKYEFQCELYSGCTYSKECSCLETLNSSTIRIICTNIQIKHMPFIQQNSSKVQIYLAYNDIYQFPKG